MLKQADDDKYKVDMERALKTCDGARAALVQIIDGTQPKPRRKLWPW